MAGERAPTTPESSKALTRMLTQAHAVTVSESHTVAHTLSHTQRRTHRHTLDERQNLIHPDRRFFVLVVFSEYTEAFQTKTGKLGPSVCPVF
jgi:hypothetical protein